MKPRDDIDRRLQVAAEQAFRGYKTAQDTAGLITGIGHDKQVLEGVHAGHPYGQRGNSPAAAETELVYLETAAGLIVVTERSALPSGVSEPASGESLTYGNAGSYAKHTAAGDIEMEPKSGQKAKLGSGATLAVGLDTDPVMESTAFNTWANAVEIALAAASSPILPAAEWDVIGPQVGLLAASATKADGE